MTPKTTNIDMHAHKFMRYLPGKIENYLYFKLRNQFLQMDININIKGISDKSRNVRKKRNLVTIKYDIIIWICEVLCSLPIIFSKSDISQILYVSLPSTLSPILYFIGILENREHMRTIPLEILKESKRKVYCGAYGPWPGSFLLSINLSLM